MLSLPIALRLSLVATLAFTLLLLGAGDAIKVQAHAFIWTGWVTSVGCLVVTTALNERI